MDNLALNVSRNCSDAADLLALQITVTPGVKQLTVSVLKTAAFQLKRMGEAKTDAGGSANEHFQLTADIDALLLEAKAAPRFRNDTYDAIDRLDATMFGGDEFMSGPEIRQHFRYYLARWEKRLQSFDEFDKAMGGDNG